MKCTFCGEEYEFSFGHHCPVMQGESKQTMTQPDLVSKLMEFVRAHNYGYLNPSEEGKPGHYWCLCGWEGPDRSSYWKHLDEALVAESLLGREGQAAAQKWCAKYGGLYEGDYCRLCDCELKQPSPSTPIVPGTPDDPRFDGVVEELVEEFAILDGDIPALMFIVGKLRQSVLEEAGKVARTHFLQYTGDNVATMELVDAIRALAERPAPAGEVKGEK